MENPNKTQLTLRLINIFNSTKNRSKNFLGTKLSIYSGILLVISFLMYVQCKYYSGCNSEFSGSLIPNTITEMIGIFFTLFFVDRLLLLNRRNQAIKFVREIISNEYGSLVAGISSAYINFVTKQPAQLVGTQKLYDIGGVLDCLDSYIDIDFYRKPVSTIVLNPDNPLSSNIEKIDYQKYCEYCFKQPINNLITRFLEDKLIRLLPEDILIDILRISDSLKNKLLETPLCYGLHIPSEKINTTAESVDSLKITLRQIGEAIIRLQQYIAEE